MVGPDSVGTVPMKRSVGAERGLLAQHAGRMNGTAERTSNMAGRNSRTNRNDVVVGAIQVGVAGSVVVAAAIGASSGVFSEGLTVIIAPEGTVKIGTHVEEERFRLPGAV